jgi:hypothetical protein
MAQMFLGSELLETEFTPQEKSMAMQFQHKELSIAYLQNHRVGIFRQLAMQEFEDPESDGKNQRVRAYWKGQLDLLEALIQSALNPEPIPLDLSQQTSGV